MPKTKIKNLTYKDLVKRKVPGVLIPGLLIAAILGWKGISDIKNYYDYKKLFPYSGVVENVEDGDTFVLKSGVRVRLIGIDSPDRGQESFDLARINLTSKVESKKVFLEYDRYQDDKFGRVLAWVWVGCESKPKFLPSSYMHKSGNESNPGLTENPKGCKKGKLVQEELIKTGHAKIVDYQDRGPTKYEAWLKSR